jgi:glycosyltransferase involved in cell wall biosynthesis
LPEFGRTGERFDLLTIRGHGPHPDELPPNVRHIQLPVAHRNLILPFLVRYLRAERPRALLTANHPLNRAALLARLVSRVPVRVTIRMGMSLSARAQAMKPAAARRMFRSMRRWYPRADAAVAPSPGVAADLERLAGVAPGRLHVIPNPIVNAALDRAAAEPLDHPWFAPGQPPVILGAGSLEPRKDFPTLLRAFARLREGRAARLVILGEGRERDALQRLAGELGIASDVDLPGYADNPYRWMSRAAVFVLCSRREGSGAVLVEALACRTPVVATDCPTGPAEILAHGRLGPLVEVGDDAGLAEALARVLERPLDGAALRGGVESFRADTAARQYLCAMGADAGAAA